MRKSRLLALLVILAVFAPGARAAVIPQDDAGSGRDAPDVPTASFRIEPGRVYSGTIEGVLLDDEDWYAFDAPAGASIEARAASPLGCLYIVDSAGTQLGFTCTSGFAELGRATATAATAGTYYLRYTYVEAHVYRFSLGVDATAPAPLPVETDPFASSGTIPPLAAAAQTGEHVVVAVVDTGVNLYHQFFRAPALTSHPSTWLTGFPASATTVNLSLGAADYATANTADAATFAGIARSTYNAGTDTFDEHLYTFPGTRVVAGISFGEYTDVVSPIVDPQPVRDDYGHGTHSAGLVAGANLAAADGNVVLVAVEVGQATFEDGVRWAARQPWIDAISVSLGLRANIPSTSSPLGDRTGMEWATREAALSGKPVFMASGNGFTGTGLAPDHCTTYTSPYTGPSWITRVGAAQSGDGSPTWWHCVPVETVSRTNVSSPVSDQMTGASVATGTSAATPNVAGHYARLLLSGRRAGSTASRVEALEYLLHSAQPVPLSPGASDPSVYPLSLADQGYGLVDQSALDAATTRLTAGSGPLPRPETTEWFARDRAIRDGLWGPGSATAGTAQVPQDDAGSGRDAPDGRANDVRIEPGVRYDGTFTGILTDEHDWYAFDGVNGDTVNVAVSAATACFELVSPSGAVLGVDSHCSLGYGLFGTFPATLTATGTWYLHVYYFVPQTYSFGFGRTGPAPSVCPSSRRRPAWRPAAAAARK